MQGMECNCNHIIILGPIFLHATPQYHNISAVIRYVINSLSVLWSQGYYIAAPIV